MKQHKYPCSGYSWIHHAPKRSCLLCGV